MPVPDEKPASRFSVAGSVTYTYDEAGNCRTRTAPGQATVTYDYDAADRLRTITQGSSIARLDYDSAARRTQLTLPNGIDVAYRYNAADLTGIDYLQGATPLGNLTYGYDPAGRINRIGGSFADTGLPPVISTSHGIDHRLNTQNTDSFTYDAAGNIETRTDVCGTTTYTWNVRGQLTQISGFTPTCQALTANFSYDALGRRQAKTINGVTTTFVYDGYTPIQERQGATITNLLTGPGIDEYLARSDGTTTRYFLPNHLGSTLALTDPAGTITTRYTYSPFGETTQTGEASSNPFQYTGRENDNTGLYYYRARYYDPKIQRFISSDPIGLAGGLNTYAYVGNNPLRWTDPSGLLTSTVGGTVRIPGWVGWITRKVFDMDVVGQGFNAGVALQFTDNCGNLAPDFGAYWGASAGGADIGIGRAAINLGLQEGTIGDLAGNGGFDVSAHWGYLGGTAKYNRANGADEFIGGSFDFGIGYNLGIAGSVAGSWSAFGNSSNGCGCAANR